MELYSTGNKTVDRMRKRKFCGNIIPQAWYHTILRETGKPYLNAIIILADILYWYRPVEVRDERSGNLVGYRKRFKADLLQRNYAQFADEFGLTKRDVTNAITALEKLGVIKRVFRTITVNGKLVPNVLYIELIDDVLDKLTYPELVTEAKPSVKEMDLKEDAKSKEKAEQSANDTQGRALKEKCKKESEPDTESQEKDADMPKKERHTLAGLRINHALFGEQYTSGNADVGYHLFGGDPRKPITFVDKAVDNHVDKHVDNIDKTISDNKGLPQISGRVSPKWVRHIQRIHT